MPAKTAILLFDLFSNYELSVALSVLAQGEKPYEVFCVKEEAVSEEGLRAKRSKPLEALTIQDYDSLLLPGCMDLRDVIDDERVLGFLRAFDLSRHVIASISSSPLLLLKAGMLEGKQYVAGVVKEMLLEEGFTMEEMHGMRDVTGLKNPDGSKTLWQRDGNLLTAVGSAFIDFGLIFGEMLGLAFDPSWYR